MLWYEALNGFAVVIIRICMLISCLGGIDIQLPDMNMFYSDEPCYFPYDDFCEVQGYQTDNGGSRVNYIRFDFYNKGYKGYIAQWIDVIFNNPLVELVVLIGISGFAIAFMKRIIRE